MSLNQLNQLYRQVIMDHGRHPRHYGRLEEATQEIELFNPTCGDAIQLQVRSERGMVEAVRFSGHGCTISMASASLMCEALQGRSEVECQAMIRTFQALVGGPGQVDYDLEEALGDAALLEGVRSFPARYKCAVLAWKAMQLAMNDEVDLEEGLSRQVEESE